MTIDDRPDRDVPGRGSPDGDLPERDDVGDGVANRDERARWNEASAETWVRLQEQFDVTLAPWLDVLLDAADVGDGERVLDVGSGNGATTLAAAARSGPSGLAVGVDLSRPMTARAEERAGVEGPDNVRFVVGDCQTDDTQVGDVPYDVAISRFGIMFFDDPAAAFANIGAGLRSGGRLVFVSWAPALEQEWLTVPLGAALQHLPMPEVGGDGPGMFGLADREVISGTLDAAGWVDVTVERCTRSMPVGGAGGVEEAVEFLLATGPGRALTENATPEAVPKAVDAIREALAPHVTSRGVELAGTAWLVTARRP